MGLGDHIGSSPFWVLAVSFLQREISLFNLFFAIVHLIGAECIPRASYCFFNFSITSGLEAAGCWFAQGRFRYRINIIVDPTPLRRAGRTI